LFAAQHLAVLLLQHLHGGHGIFRTGDVDGIRIVGGVAGLRQG
jgi:hypothetical protein